MSDPAPEKTVRTHVRWRRRPARHPCTGRLQAVVAAVGGIGARSLLAVEGLVVGLGVHRAGIPAGSLQRVAGIQGPSVDFEAEPIVLPCTPRSVPGISPLHVVDVKYRVIS